MAFLEVTNPCAPRKRGIRGRSAPPDGVVRRIAAVALRWSALCAYHARVGRSVPAGRVQLTVRADRQLDPDSVREIERRLVFGRRDPGGPAHARKTTSAPSGKATTKRQSGSIPGGPTIRSRNHPRAGRSKAHPRAAGRNRQGPNRGAYRCVYGQRCACICGSHDAPARAGRTAPQSTATLFRALARKLMTSKATLYHAPTRAGKQRSPRTPAPCHSRSRIASP